MDFNHRRKDSVPDVHINVTGDDHTEITTPPPTMKTSNKRSFDVAFLMLPDDKLKQKQMKASKQVFAHNYNLQISTTQDNNLLYNNNEKSDDYDSPNGAGKESPHLEETVRIPEENKLHNHTRIIHNTPQKTQIFDDPSLGKPKVSYESEIDNYRHKVSLNPSPEQKSAFTKVNMVTKDSRLSPNLSMSPDLSYQNSLSPSPPIINRQYQNFPPNILSPNQIFKTQNVPTYQNNFMQENFSPSPSTSIDNPFLMKTAPNPEILQPNFAKMRPILQYRPELPYLGGNGYPASFQPQDMLKIAPPDIRHPAAAILTSLLPPSFAALSLPAQNVCAKCNISFRMTSDLVYHMRSHHKNDVANDLTKRRREEKLKCPVCAESFRERHHLTRHMTAHQDKEGDVIEPENKKKNAFVTFNK